MGKQYKLRIPDGCEVESVGSTTINGKNAILVLLAPVFNPQPGDYVTTEDGQVGIKTKDGYFQFETNIYPFTKYANDTQKDAFNKLLKEKNLHYDKDSQNVVVDFKDGDIVTFIGIVTGCKHIAIYKENSRMLVGLNSEGKLLFKIGHHGETLHHATPEESATLMQELSSQGYDWDAIQKKIVKKPQIGDLCIFWNNKKKCADVGILREYKGDSPVSHRDCTYKHCIRFENEVQFKCFLVSE